MDKSKKIRMTAALLLAWAIVLLWMPQTQAAQAAQTEQTAQSLSKDNSLKSLSLSKGTLSPEFESSTISYTAEVGAEVDSVEVDAQLSNANASIESITGNTDLQPGENTIQVTVVSQAGTTAVYTIVLTKSAEEGDASENTPDEEVFAVINEDGTVTVGDQVYPVASAESPSNGTEGQVYSESAYESLKDEYETLKKYAMIGVVVCVIVICVLIVALAMMRSALRKKTEDDVDFDDWEDDEDFLEEKPKTEKRRAKTSKTPQENKPKTPRENKPEAKRENVAPPQEEAVTGRDLSRTRRELNGTPQEEAVTGRDLSRAGREPNGWPEENQLREKAGRPKESPTGKAGAVLRQDGEEIEILDLNDL